ncbi:MULTISPECIES: phage terminase small subunit [Paenibacillus]|uniref:phage terminase small subunit n=1 Tax=Paenibacillus TaxID=44249 RepID=UPI00046FCF87|nr:MULTISPECIES: phage terminase small subunit [Paenibacillus]MBE0335104.1 hypothetical protein [Paenibacillus sp. 23TSA30-6]
MNWEEIRNEYENTDISLSDLASKHDVKYPTIKSRKQRQGWSKDASSRTKDASGGKKDASKKRGPPKGNRNAAGHGAPEGNQNAVGNSGGPGGPARNDKAVTHGFFRKFLPDETAEIMEQLENRSPLDMMWDQITLKYAAILRAQPIMFVKDHDDMTKVVKRSKLFTNDKTDSEDTEHEIQFAWDKQATFLNAQSRAMGRLQSLIKQYEEMCRLTHADEEQRLRIEVLKGKVKALEKDAPPDEKETEDGFMAALKSEAAQVWADEE